MVVLLQAFLSTSSTHYFLAFHEQTWLIIRKNQYNNSSSSCFLWLNIILNIDNSINANNLQGLFQSVNFLVFIIFFVLLASLCENYLKFRLSAIFRRSALLIFLGADTMKIFIFFFGYSTVRTVLWSSSSSSFSITTYVHFLPLCLNF